MPLPKIFPAFIYKKGEGVSSGLLVHSAEEIPAGGDWTDAPTHNDRDRFAVGAPAAAAPVADTSETDALRAEIATKDKIIADQGARIEELEKLLETIGDAADAADGVDAAKGDAAKGDAGAAKASGKSAKK